MTNTMIHPRMPDDLLKRLDEYAERTHRSRNACVVLAVEQLLAAPPEKPATVKRIVGRRAVEEPLEDARATARRRKAERDRQPVEHSLRVSPDSSTTRRTR